MPGTVLVSLDNQVNETAVDFLGAYIQVEEKQIINKQICIVC